MSHLYTIIECNNSHGNIKNNEQHIWVCVCALSYTYKVYELAVLLVLLPEREREHCNTITITNGKKKKKKDSSSCSISTCDRHHLENKRPFEIPPPYNAKQHDAILLFNGFSFISICSSTTTAMLLVIWRQIRKKGRNSMWFVFVFSSKSKKKKKENKNCMKTITNCNWRISYCETIVQHGKKTMLKSCNDSQQM